jgi:glycine cleavage system aminomethyltransferase T
MHNYSSLSLTGPAAHETSKSILSDILRELPFSNACNSTVEENQACTIARLKANQKSLTAQL